jgi:hypothetical protein
LLALGLGAPACGLFGRSPGPNIPDDEARHRAALTELNVQNRTDQNLTIGYRSATPPAQEVVLGTVNAGRLAKVAPIPGGEPIVLTARRGDGREFSLTPRSYPIDGQWTWDIPASAPFRLP